MVLSTLLVAACSSTPADGPKDMSMILSSCGKPGDVGNSKGVGTFCTSLGDCTGQAVFCSSLGNGNTPSAGDTYFCTIYPCHVGDAGTANECGENATCSCGSQGGTTGCACTPDSCLKP